MRRLSTLTLLLLSTASLAAQPSTPVPQMAAAAQPSASSQPATAAAQPSSSTPPLSAAAQVLAAERFMLTARDAALSCPVKVTVDRNPQGAVVYTGLSTAPQQGQGLTLSFFMEANPIVAADVVVFGYAAGTHVFPATPLAPNEASETFHLTASADHPLTRYTLRTEHLAAINRIELTRIQYADGATWQPSATSHCAAAPSLLVLVGATR